MEYFESKPSGAASRYVKRYWSLKHDPPETDALPELVLPDGCVEIVFDLSDRFIQYFDCGKIELQPRTIIAGQMTGGILIGPTGNTDMFGIRFHPAGAYAFLGISIHELTDRIEDARNVIGESESMLFEQFSHARDLNARITIFEQFFLSGVKADRPNDDELDFAVNSIIESGGVIAIGKLARRLGWSERRLERRFRERVGISPKVFSRITRFGNLVRAVDQNGSTDMLDRIYSAGYYDQSHLVREFREFTGTTPTDFFRANHLLSRYFLGDD